MIVLDTSGVLAAVDGRQAHHDAAARALRQAEGPRLLSPLVLAELDYLVRTRLGRQAQLGLLRDVTAGAYQLERFEAGDVASAAQVIDRYGDLDLSLADASLVVLAERSGTADILTLDQRHFRAMTDSGGRPFRVLPADA